MITEVNKQPSSASTELGCHSATYHMQRFNEVTACHGSIVHRQNNTLYVQALVAAGLLCDSEVLSYSLHFEDYCCMYGLLL